MAKQKLVLDIGPGPFPYKAKSDEKIVTVDFNSIFKPTVIHDLTKFPYPFPSNKFDKIYASHIIEHIPNTTKFMEQIHRISKKGAKIIIKTPHFSSRAAWINPTHHRTFSIFVFQFFDKRNPESYGNCNFRCLKKEFRYLRQDVPHHKINAAVGKFISYLANLNQDLCERLWCYWIGGFSEIYFELEAVK